MRPETLKLIYDIRQACGLISRFTEGKDFDDYAGDDLLRSGEERQFEIVGEALNRAVKIEPEIEDMISNVKRIISFRNFLIHAYPQVDHNVVWDIVKDSLPVLHKEVDEILERKYKDSMTTTDAVQLAIDALRETQEEKLLQENVEITICDLKSKTCKSLPDKEVGKHLK